MSKIKKRTRHLLGGIIPIGTAVLTYIARTEHTISLINEIKSSKIMEYADIIIPVLLGIIAFGLYWLGLIIYDWIHIQLDKIELIESNSKRLSNNETSIKQIENNQVVQHSINAQVIEFISEQSGEGLTELYNRYDAKHIEHIKNTNTNLSDGQASTGLQRCKGAKNRFHLILDKP